MSRCTTQARSTNVSSIGQASACQSSVPDWRRSATSARVSAGLAARLTSALPDAFADAGIAPVQISHSGTRVLVEFPESDFLLTVHRSNLTGSFETTVIACVRAPAPDLSTWWSQWKLKGEMSAITELHLGELTMKRRKLLEMLEDHLRDNGESVA